VNSANPAGLEGDGAVTARFPRRVFAVFALLAALSLGISVAGQWAGRAIALAGHSDDPTTREIVIGNDVLVVPANMIRFEAARRDGIADRLDLYIRWPQLDGYSTEASDDFNHAHGGRSVIFLSFEDRMMSRDMSGRFGPIYSSLIVRPGKAAPAGLTAYALKPEVGYVDEMLIVGDESSARPFVARCLSGEAARQSLAPCERDIHVGRDLNLVYRMPAELAASWRDVDAAVTRLAASFLRATP
jgi:hypothetical protein